MANKLVVTLENPKGVVEAISAEEQTYINANVNRDNRSEEEIAEWNATQYVRDRTDTRNTNGYPTIADQLDMQYHDKVDGTTTWEDAIQAVKDKYPKP
jgi:hypothetical protein|tara:strand:+ start:763 stop:1056 length:294 start_codon:yes stop_codon:yes gene_type:complete